MTAVGQKHRFAIVVEELKFSVEHFDERGDLQEGAGPSARPRRGTRGLQSLPDQISAQAIVSVPGRQDLEPK
jgi:hypothetical protein